MRLICLVLAIATMVSAETSMGSIKDLQPYMRSWKFDNYKKCNEFTDLWSNMSNTNMPNMSTPVEGILYCSDMHIYFIISIISIF